MEYPLALKPMVPLNAGVPITVLIAKQDGARKGHIQMIILQMVQ
jgi:hypothetical protein